MMYSACKLNKQGDNIHTWRIHFPIWNQSVVPCPILTVASWPVYRCLRRQVRWYVIPIFLRIFHVVKGLGIVNKGDVDVFLELLCFFDDLTDVGNLISGSSAFSKSSLNILKFIVHGLLKPDLEDFEHYFASVWDECNCVVVWAFFGIGMKTDLFQSCGHCWVFQICWHIECSSFTASPFRISNSSAGISWPPLALFKVMLPESHLTSHSRISGSRWVITPLWLSGSWRYFLYSSSVYSCHLLISYASVRSIIFLTFIEPIFAWNVPLVSLIFLKRSLVFPILLFSSISLHWSVRKAFLSLFAILWNSAFKWEYLSFLVCFSLLFISQLFVRPPQATILPFSFLFHGDGLDPCLMYNVMNLCP